MRFVFLAVFCLASFQAPSSAAAEGDAYANFRSTAADSVPAAKGETEDRKREGTPLQNVSGQFVEVGRRWLFTIDGTSTSFQVLENLALHRVSLAARQAADDNRWTVQGSLTEYGGENYLLLLSVVRTAQGAKPSELPTLPKRPLLERARTP